MTVCALQREKHARCFWAISIKISIVIINTVTYGTFWMRETSDEQLQSSLTFQKGNFHYPESTYCLRTHTDTHICNLELLRTLPVATKYLLCLKALRVISVIVSHLLFPFCLSFSLFISLFISLFLFFCECRKLVEIAGVCLLKQRWRVISPLERHR